MDRASHSPHRASPLPLMPARAWRILPSPPRPLLHSRGRVLMFLAFNTNLLAGVFMCPTLFTDHRLCALQPLPRGPLTDAPELRRYALGRMRGTPLFLTCQS